MGYFLLNFCLEVIFFLVFHFEILHQIIILLKNNTKKKIHLPAKFFKQKHKYMIKRHVKKTFLRHDPEYNLEFNSSKIR